MNRAIRFILIGPSPSLGDQSPSQSPFHSIWNDKTFVSQSKILLEILNTILTNLKWMLKIAGTGLCLIVMSRFFAVRKLAILLWPVVCCWYLTRTKARKYMTMMQNYFVYPWKIVRKFNEMRICYQKWC